MTTIPVCEICREEEPKLVTCKKCGTKFCEYCGDITAEICIECGGFEDDE